MKKIIVLVLPVLAGIVLNAKDLKLSENNIPETVKALTLEEKAMLVVGFKVEKVSGAAGATCPIPRLGIPSITLADGPAGLRINPTRDGDEQTYYCTGFPIGMMMASTWNRDVVGKVGQAMGNEVLEYGVDVLLAPGANIHRNSMCGRNFEYYSEDPLLAGRTAAAFISGVQSQGVGTCIKHFALNNQETNRLICNSIVSDRAMSEIYLRVFEIAVKESQPWTVMTSYNCINGIQAAENKWLISDKLRGDWGFEGCVMTDWGGGYRAENIISSGNDMIQPGGQYWCDEIVRAVRDGRLDEKDLDACVGRVLELIVKTPTFKGYKYSDKPDLASHALVGREAAEEGTVLLKRTALPYAEGTDVALFGVGSYDFVAGGTGSGDVHRPYIIDLRDALSQGGFKLDGAVDEYYSEFMKLEAVRCRNIDTEAGLNLWFLEKERPLEALNRELVENAAKRAQTAVITLTRVSGESKDRLAATSFYLSSGEMDLIDCVAEAFHSEGKTVTVLLNVCGAVETASWKDKVDDILICYLPGQDGSRAVADILCGRVNPSGRLPLTLPIRWEDEPSSRNFPQILADKAANYSFYRNFYDGVVRNDVKNIDYTLYEEDIFVGYRYHSSVGQEVSYPFGYGLSYTDFEWSEPATRKVAGGWEVSVKVKNIGSREGKDVVEIYLAHPADGEYLPAEGRPTLELKGYAKTGTLGCRETETIKIFIPEWICDAAQGGKLPKGYCFTALRSAGSHFSSKKICDSSNL